MTRKADKLYAIAERQQGYFTAAQAVACGYPSIKAIKTHHRSALLPVGGIAVKMHDRHDQDLVSPNPEEDAEGECPRETTLNIQFDCAVQSRVHDNAVHGILHRCEKA